jgi:hypothetical protein
MRYCRIPPPPLQGTSLGTNKLFILTVGPPVLELQCLVKEVTPLSDLLVGALFWSESVVFRILHSSSESANLGHVKHCT